MGARLFRNQVGMSWFGRPINKTSTTVTIEYPQQLRSGLCVGSSDLIGWTPIVITQDMVGKTVAVFTACEVKYSTTKTTQEQKQFVDIVNSAGGIAMIVRSIEEFEQEIKKTTTCCVNKQSN